MIFKTLVECLLKQIRDPENSIALNALQTLTREMKQDLTQAFLLSQPLVERHSLLFWESRSFLDFLIKLQKLPSHVEFFPKPPCQRKEGRCDPGLDPSERVLKQQLEEIQEQLRQCLQEKKHLQDQLTQLQQNIESGQTALQRCQAKNETLHTQMNKLKQTHETHMQQKSAELKTVIAQLDLTRDRWQECEEKFRGCLEKVDKLEDYSRDLFKICEKLLAANEEYSKALNTYASEEATLSHHKRELLNYIEFLQQHKTQLEVANEELQRALEETFGPPDSTVTIRECNSVEMAPLNDPERTRLTWNPEQVVDDLKQQLEDCQQQKRDLENRLDACRAEKKELENKLTKLSENACSEEDGSAVPYAEDSQPYNVPQILHILKQHYPSPDMEHALSNDLTKLQILKDQMRRLKDEADRVNVEPHEFADVVLNVHAQIPEREKTWHRIAEEFHLPKNLETLYLEISKRLKEHRLANELHQYFATEFGEWASRIPYEIEKLKNFITTNYDQVQSTDLDWLGKGILLIEKTRHDFTANDTIINTLMQLTPDVPSDSNKCAWKETLMNRYTLLSEHAKSLLGEQPIETLPTIMHTLKERASLFTHEPDWLLRYIHQLEEKCTLPTELKCKTRRSHTPYETDSFLRECEKLAQYFKVGFRQDTFYNDIVSSKSMKLYVENNMAFTNLKTHLAHYFTTCTNVLDIPTYVEEIFQNLLMQHGIASCTLTLENVTFEKHVNFHLKTAVDYTSNKCDLDRKQQLEDQMNSWVGLYQQWLAELNLSACTPKEDFLQLLKTYKTKVKRSTECESLDVTSEKKMKFDYNFTETQIHNLFLALYKEYFTLKWNHLNQILPTDTELVDKLKQKLQILEKMTPHSRTNILLQIYLEYIKLDLAVGTQKMSAFSEITNVDTMLERSMKETEESLSKMMTDKQGKL